MALRCPVRDTSRPGDYQDTFMNRLRVISAALALLLTGLPISAQVTCKQTDDIIVVTRNGHHVLTYHKTVKVPAGVDAKYGRSGFIHPVTTPSGRVITDDYPVPHHSHQHGIFFAWRSANFEGEKMNFWEPSKQSIRHHKVLEIFTKESFAGFRVELAHVSGEKTILRETWTVKVSAATGFIDLTSEQNCATPSPITLEKFHYGGMAIRGSRQWFKDARGEFVKECTMLTNEGLSQAKGNHSRPKWVCMTGPVDNAPVSITFIPHPTNFRFPQHVRLHPNMPYFCFIPTVEKPFVLNPGTPWISRYRIVAEDGKPDTAKLDSVQQAFAKAKG